MQNLTLKDAADNPQDIIDQVQAEDHTRVGVNNTAGKNLFSAALITGAAVASTGGLSTGIGVGAAAGVVTSAAVGVAGVALAQAAVIGVAAATGLFVANKLILQPTRDIIEEIIQAPAVEKQQIAKKSDRLLSQYTSLYGFDPAKVGLTRRYLEKDMVDSIFSGLAKAQAWGYESPIELNVKKDYAFVTGRANIQEHFKDSMIKAGYTNYLAEKSSAYISNCAELFMQNEGVKTCHICATFYWDGTDSDVIHDLFISGAGLWGGNPLTITTYNKDYVNPQTPPIVAPARGVVYSAEYGTNATFYVFNAGTYSETYSRRVYQAMKWTETSQANKKFCVFDNIVEEGSPLAGFTTAPGIKDGTITRPRADGSQTMADWLAENNLTLPTTFTDAEGHVYVQVNPYEAGMNTTDEIAATLTTGVIDTTSEDTLDVVQTELGTAELINATNAIAGVAATLNPNPPIPNPTPVFPPPSIAASSGLFAIYHPTLAQVKEFSQWLWSSNFIDQILKVFSDPMDGVIGFHAIYCTPTDSGSANIKLGYLDSGVNSYICKDQYVSIDCGEVTLAEYYGSALDYAPYTKVTAYLPFIGFVELDTQVYMGGKINIEYIVDILTGCCTCNIYSIKQDQKRLVDNYSGQCSTQLPYSSGSYLQALSSITSAAVGGLSGGVAGAAAGAATALISGNVRTQTKQGGSITGNAGAMGCKIPFLIIDRNTPKLPINYNKTQGFPASTSGTLSQFTGYTRVKDCHLDNVPATDEEKAQIMQLLKSGVIV